MQNLIIPINNESGKPTVNARELHKFLESKQDFSTWMKNRISQYEFLENEDFTKVHKKMELSKTGQNSIEYHISLDMAKELSMVERNEKGKEARRYFIEQEKKLKDVQNIIETNDPILMLGQATNMMRQQQLLQGKRIEAVEEKLDEIQAQTASRKLIVNDPPAGFENKKDVIESVARIAVVSKAVVEAVLNAYSQDIQKSKYMVERLDGLVIVQTYPTCYFTFDVINCVKHALKNSKEYSPCYRIFTTLGNKRMKHVGEVMA